MAQRKRNPKYRFDRKRIKIPVGVATYYADKPAEFRTVAAYFFLKRLTASSVFDNFNQQSEKVISKQYGVSHSTMKTRVKEMIAMGLAWRDGKKLRLISRQRFIDRNKAFLTQSFWKSMKGLNKETLQEWVEANVISEKQIHCRYAELKKKNQEVYLSGVKKVKLTEEHLAEADATQKISGKRLAIMFGRTHHSTGLRKQKKLEKAGHLKITRFTPELISDNAARSGLSELPFPYFFASGAIFKGICNKLERNWESG